MLERNTLLQEFEHRREDLSSFLMREKEEAKLFAEALATLASSDRNSFDRIFEHSKRPPAIPADEFFEGNSVAVRFGISWKNHQAAREWASEILEDRTTFAADGSQIYSGTVTSLPIAAIQIGWFENPHCNNKRYTKDASFKLLSASELFRVDEEPMNPDVRVDEQRYIGEVRRLMDFLDRHRGWQERGERMPVAFFDNPLLVPFSQRGLQRSLISETVELVERSRDTLVPIIGYVDRSFSRDILSTLRCFLQNEAVAISTLCDASFFHVAKVGETSLIENWGDRSTYFLSQRQGLEFFVDKETDVSSVGFVFLRTSSTSLPVRIDVPTWVNEAGFLDEVIDVIRGECIVGLGYPYCLETADQTAVISTQDRKTFLAALQRFARREKLAIGVNQKDTSKGRRRY